MFNSSGPKALVTTVGLMLHPGGDQVETDQDKARQTPKARATSTAGHANQCDRWLQPRRSRKAPAKRHPTKSTASRASRAGHQRAVASTTITINNRKTVAKNRERSFRFKFRAGAPCKRLKPQAASNGMVKTGIETNLIGKPGKTNPRHDVFEPGVNVTFVAKRQDQPGQRHSGQTTNSRPPPPPNRHRRQRQRAGSKIIGSRPGLARLQAGSESGLQAMEDRHDKICPSPKRHRPGVRNGIGRIAFRMPQQIKKWKQLNRRKPRYQHNHEPRIFATPAKMEFFSATPGPARAAPAWSR